MGGDNVDTGSKFWRFGANVVVISFEARRENCP
jgi:hypothetical protein